NLAYNLYLENKLNEILNFDLDSGPLLMPQKSLFSEYILDIARRNECDWKILDDKLEEEMKAAKCTDVDSDNFRSANLSLGHTVMCDGKTYPHELFVPYKVVYRKILNIIV